MRLAGVRELGDVVGKGNVFVEDDFKIAERRKVKKLEKGWKGMQVCFIARYCSKPIFRYRTMSVDKLFM